MAIPFGVGVAVAYGLFHEFKNEPNLADISFPVFALFIGVALAITAFPVLCRILSSLKLLNTNVGVIVLSSGIANDVVGWVLLALCVTLVNSGAGVTAVYVLLCSIGWALFLAYAVRPCFMWILRRTRSLENGPSEGVVALTLMIVLVSAWFTSIIGVHSIFGAFMVGLMCPHEGGFAIKITEKIEDLISTLLVPLFFANAGLSTDISLLDTGMVWAYLVCIIVVAFLSKIIGGTIGARMNGLVWRESFTIGTLMSCKGLVELIVLNIGLEARILSTRTFTMFVVMALVTTFATAPAVSLLYPPSYQRKLQLWKQGCINWDGTPIARADDEAADASGDAASRILVYLRTDGLSSLLSTISFFTNGRRGGATATGEAPPEQINNTVAPASGQQALLRVHGHRLIELSERNSSVMKVTEIEQFAQNDPIIKAFGICANNNTRDVVISGQIAVVPQHLFADTLITEAGNAHSDLVLVPWSETGTLSELQSFFSVAPNRDPLANSDFLTFASKLFTIGRNTSAVATYIDSTLFRQSSHLDSGRQQPLHRQTSITSAARSDCHDPTAVKFYSAETTTKRQMFALYAGLADDVYAVRLALQMAQSKDVELTVVDAASTDSPSYADFGALKDIIDPSLAGRVRFVEMQVAHGGNAGLLASGLLSSRSEADRSAVFVVGRSVEVAGTPDLEETMAAAETLGHVLGSVGEAVAEEIKKTNVTNVSLMVVQAKRQSESSEPARKMSHESA